MAAMAALIAGCSSSPGSNPTLTGASSTVDERTTAPSPQAPRIATLGDFPEFPHEPLPDAVAGSLQAVLDGAVEDGTVGGVSAAVVVAGSGSWSGASGVDEEDNPLKPDTQLVVASVGKTVTAAQILRLVEEGELGLDDPITEHLPPRAAMSFDANRATIRDVMGIRSGITDPPGYEYLVDSGATTTELLE
jgi:D-alanyl-D-alanine carboxypeptidase